MPGAPLSNNLCERALKKAILHRKNALFYRTLNGAKVGDLFMTLIHTAELHRVVAFDYLLTLLRHAAAVELHRGPGAPRPRGHRPRTGLTAHRLTGAVRGVAPHPRQGPDDHRRGATRARRLRSRGPAGQGARLRQLATR